MRNDCLWQLFLMTIHVRLGSPMQFHNHLSGHRRQHNILPVIWNNETSDPINLPLYAPGVGETTRYGVRNEMCPSGVEPQRNTDGNIMWCRLDAECRNDYECVPIVGLIHFGNSVKYCCPTKSSYCTKKPHFPPDLSACTKPPTTIYYFDVKRKKCRPYVVASCNRAETMVDEMENRFGTLRDCKIRCGTTACEIGESALYLDESADQPYVCESSDHCPHGYVCRLDRLFRRQVCCGKTQFDPCPNYRTFLIPYIGSPKQCKQNKYYDLCPNDYVCASSPQNIFSYCCANIDGICPMSQKPYIHPLTGNAMKCNIHSYDAACPPGFVCHSAVVGASFGFCCSRSVVYNCPRNTKPFINIATNLPQKCTVGVTTCSHGYQCLNSEPNARIGYCCTPPSSVEAISQTLALITPARFTTTTTDSPASISVEILEETAESHGYGSHGRNGNDRGERLSSTTLTPSSIGSLELSHETLYPIKTTENIAREKILQVINTLSCPEDFEAMTYPRTSLILHCTRGHANDCPAPSKCLKAVDDILERALCCVHRDDKALIKSTGGGSGSHEISSFKIVGGNIQLGESTDPSCPTIILQKSCVPGRAHTCKEESFFCQFNKQFNEYLCCSKYRNIENRLMYSQFGGGD